MNNPTDYLAACLSPLSHSPEGVTVRVNRDQKYQTLMGFGGAFTDSTGYNVAKLSKAAQDNVWK